MVSLYRHPALSAWGRDSNFQGANIMSIHTDAQTIIQEALTACLPDQAVRRALEGRTFGAGRVFLVAAGKAAWQMADCAARLLGDRLEGWRPGWW